MFLLALLIGCSQYAPFPNVGRCTTPPDRPYEYGQISPGKCITGPVEMQFSEDSDGSPVLLVTNSNPYQIFNAGSLLSISWDDIDPSISRNAIADLDNSYALEMPSYSAGLATNGELGLVTVRLSESARTREENDEVYLIDLSDLPQLTLSDRGTDGGSSVSVGPDPVDVVVDSVSGRAFVANRTAHSISVLDLASDEISVIIPWEEHVLTSAEFFDNDLSESRATLADMEVTDSTLLPDEIWSMEWIAGTWRLWLPSEEGISRSQTTGNGTWNASAIGVELEVEDADGLLDSITDPDWVSGRLFFADGGDIHSAISGSWLGDWEYEYLDLFTGRSDMWDEEVGAPAVTFDEEGVWLFYEGTDGETRAIGAAFSEDGYDFTRESSPVLEPAWDHESEGIGDPALVFDAEIDLWRMFYSAFDGTRWTIGHATSPDLLLWESDPDALIQIDDGDIAAPVISRSVGEWKLWASVRTDDIWEVAEATSSDGERWTVGSAIPELEFDDSVAALEEPPGLALDADPSDAFRVEGEDWGILRYMAYPGAEFESVEHGWIGTPIAGFELDLGDAGSPSNGGIRIDSVLMDSDILDTDKAWLTLKSSGGIERIGLATLTEEGIEPQEGAVLEGSADFHKSGVSYPVVFEDGDQLRMYFAGLSQDINQIGTATSSDGETWIIAEDPVLSADANWESASVIPGSVEQLDDGTIRLWYSGSNGEEWRISSATSDDGINFSRDAADEAWLFDAGAPGEWDDSGVRDPWIVAGTNADGEDGVYLFYTGFDGDVWRGGAAFRSSTGNFERSWSGRTESTRAVLPITGGMFHPDGIQRPIILHTDDGWSGWFSGLIDEDYRTGTARGSAPDRLHKTPRRPTLGDRIEFSTERGDPDIDAIPLDTELSELSLTGLGLVALHIDESRGFLYALTKHQPWIVVIDIEDGPDSNDLNVLDIESVIRVQTASGGAGFRQVVEMDADLDTNGDGVIDDDDEGLLYGLNDDPDSVFVLDLSELEDDAFSEVLYDTQVGGLTTPRDLTSDEGLENTASIGPGQLALHPDGRRLFVTNFNDNSVSVFDLSIGLHGQLIDTISLVGENPYAIAIHPNGTQAVVGNFTGEMNDDDVAQSTLAVIDLDETSSSYLEVLTWIVND